MGSQNNNGELGDDDEIDDESSSGAHYRVEIDSLEIKRKVQQNPVSAPMLSSELAAEDEEDILYNHMNLQSDSYGAEELPYYDQSNPPNLK